MTNRISKLTILFGEFLFMLLIINNNIGCLFYKLFKIKCPGCGMTRAFISIIKHSYLDAIKYNILSIPFFIFLIIINILLVYDIIYNKNKTNNIFIKLGKHIKFVLFLLLISFIYNNI